MIPPLQACALECNVFVGLPHAVVRLNTTRANTIATEPKMMRAFHAARTEGAPVSDIQVPVFEHVKGSPASVVSLLTPSVQYDVAGGTAVMSGRAHFPSTSYQIEFRNVTRTV